MTLPARVTICEVGTRDGFQIEPDFIPTELKIEVVDRLSATGMPRIEVTSFVSPKAVPALRDAEAVTRAVRGVDGVLHLCLGQEERMDFRALMRAGAGDDDLRAAIRQAIDLKPERHEFTEAPHKLVRFMNMTGG